MSPTTRDYLADRVETIRAAAAEIVRNERDEYDHGWRYVDGPCAAGDALASSHERDDNGDSTGELTGTSTMETLDALLDYMGWATSGTIVLVRGVRCGSGSLEYEMLMDEAEAAVVWSIDG